MVFLRFPFIPGYKCVDTCSGSINNCELHDRIISCIGTEHYSLYCNGKKLLETDFVAQDAVIYVTLPLPGGKGGFGSMLRAIGAQIEKTTNREACRDLSGRRLRDINEEQRIKKWLAKKAEREEEKMRRRREKLERLKRKPNHNFVDFEFEKEISQLPERIDDALTEGLEKAVKNPPEKRVASQSGKASKKKRLWVEDDLSSESSSSNSDVEDAPMDESDTKSSTDDSNHPTPGCSKFDSGAYSEENSAESTGLSNESKASEDCVKSSNTSENNDEDTIDNESKSDKVTNEAVKNESDGKKEEKEVADASLNNKCPVDSKVDALVNLSDFQDVLELEALGLDWLKNALTARGLKCGGTLADRAQRLWKIRGMQPHEYPSNLLAKSKK